MTKKEKKEVIKKLFQEVEQTKNIDEYAINRSKLFNEVISAGYPQIRLEGTIKAADTWCKDFDKNMEAKISNVPLPVKFFIKGCKAEFLDFIYIGEVLIKG